MKGRKEERSGGYPTHTPPLPDFKDSPSEKESFSSAQAYRFVTPLFHSQKCSTSVERLLIPSEANALGNEAFRAAPRMCSVLHIPGFFKSHLCDGSLLGFSSLGTGNL